MPTLLLSRHTDTVATVTDVAAGLPLLLQVRTDLCVADNVGLRDAAQPLWLVDLEHGIDAPTGQQLLHHWSQSPDHVPPQLILIGSSNQSHPLREHALCVLPQPVNRAALAAALTTARTAVLQSQPLRSRLAACEHVLQQRDRLLAQLAHELRNPLFTIQSVVEALNLNPDTLSASTPILDRQVQHLRDLVDTLYEFSHFSGEPSNKEVERHDLRTLLEQAAENVRARLSARSQELVVLAADEPVWVRGRLTRLIQVLTNLLDNAGKYSPVGRPVEASVVTDGEWAVITVTDHGKGIAAHDLGRVFEPFVQLAGHRPGSSSGLGLGLSIVREIVAQHGGTVNVASGGPGKGSTFEVRLPRADDH